MIVPKQTKAFGFSWTNDPTLTNSNVLEKINRMFEAAAKNNKLQSVRTSDLEMGAGLYMASDPIASKSFGRKLIMAPLRTDIQKNVALFRDDMENWSNLVQDLSLPGIFYSFGGIEFVPGGGNAIVVRKSGVLDESGLSVVDLSASIGKPWFQLPPPANATGANTEKILLAYGGNLDIFDRWNEAPLIFTGKPERPISNFGILLGIRSQLSSLSSALKQKIMALKDNAQCGVCMERLNFGFNLPRLNTDENRINLLKDDLFDRVIWEFHNKNDRFLSGSEEITIKQAMLILKTMEIFTEEKTPANFKELGQMLIDDFQRNPSAYQNLTSAFLLGKEMQAHWSKEGFSKWHML
jgi:hypothetical protein